MLSDPLVRGLLIDTAALARGLAAWNMLLGAVSGEVFEHLGTVPGADALFVLHLQLAGSLFLLPLASSTPLSTAVSTASGTVRSLLRRLIGDVVIHHLWTERVHKHPSLTPKTSPTGHRTPGASDTCGDTLSIPLRQVRHHCPQPLWVTTPSATVTVDDPRRRCGAPVTVPRPSTAEPERDRVVHSRGRSQHAAPPALNPVVPIVHTTDDDYETLTMMAIPENDTRTVPAC